MPGGPNREPVRTPTPRARETGDWLSTHEAARVLGIAPRTLYRFINDGDLPAYKFGRVIRLRRAEVDEYIESTRVKPGDLDNLVPKGSDDPVDDYPEE